MTQSKLKNAKAQEQMTLDLGLGKKIEAKFDGGRISSDGGLLLLRKADKMLELTALAALCFKDERRSDLVKHDVESLLRQRVYAIAAGYEDCNDASRLRFDPMHKLAVGRRPDGEQELASQPTLSRFENSADKPSLDSLQKLLVHAWIRTQKKQPKVVKLSMDTTCDEVHGYQQLSFYHGYYGTECFTPLFIFTEDGFPLAALLRPGNAGLYDSAPKMLKDVVTEIRRRWPGIKIELAADAAFAVPDIYNFCERNKVTYYMCIKENHALTCNVKDLIDESKQAFEELTGFVDPPLKHGRKADEKARKKAWRLEQERMRGLDKDKGRVQEIVEDLVVVKVYSQFKYQAREWPLARRIVAKAQYGKQGPDVRFVITNSKYGSPRAVYERYCERAQCENWIKELKNYLKCDRTSCQEFQANQLRLLLHTFAYILIWQLKKSSGMKISNSETIRRSLLKVGVLVKETLTKISLHLASEHPWQSQFHTAWLKL